MRGRPGGLKAAALVDRDVDQHRLLLHDRELLARDDVRGLGADDQHGADDHVRLRQQLLDRERGRVKGVGPAAEGDVELAQPVDRAIEHRHRGAHADRDLSRVIADDTTADHEHVGGRHAGHAAEQDATAAQRLLQHEGTGLGRDLAGDLGHRRQQRQATVAVLDRLIGDAGRTGLGERVRQLDVGGKVQVGEQQVPRFEHRDLNRLRLLDLDDHLGLGEDRGRVREDRRALLDVVVVGDRRPEPCALLDADLVARVHELAHACRRQRDPVLIDLDLGRYSNFHAISSLPRSASQNSILSLADARSLPVNSSTRLIR